jgi:hypothetical protein
MNPSRIHRLHIHPQMRVIIVWQEGISKHQLLLPVYNQYSTGRNLEEKLREGLKKDG